MSEWQPIETAPKDGKYILIFNDCESIEVCRWVGHTWYNGDVTYDGMDIKALYWMPLPPPPTLNSEDLP